ncbi:hypothetical protein [Streptomyces sp. NPDC001500]
MFAAEVEKTRPVWEQKPTDGRALMARMDEVEKRLTPEPAVRVEPGRVQVQVRVPAGASKRRVEQITARAIAGGLRAAREAES